MSTNHPLLDDPAYQRFLRWESDSDDSVLVRRIYCDIAGDVPGGLFLSQLIYWFLLGQNGQPRVRVFKFGRFWVAKRRQDWYAECRISSRQFDRTVRKLEKLGIVTTILAKFNGTPVLHVSANWDTLVARITALESKRNGIHQLVKSSEPNEACSHYTEGQVDCDKLDESLTESTPENTSETKDKSSPSSSVSDETGKEKPARSLIAPPLAPNFLQDSGQAPVHSSPGKFVAPTIQELTDYIRSLGCADAENKAAEFYRKYESQNWLVRGFEMRSWRKMVEAWKKNWDASPKRTTNTHVATEESGHERLLATVARSKQLQKRL